MGIFNRLSMLFSGAPKAEVDAVNNALRDVALQSLVTDDIEPAPKGYKPNRKERRSYHHGLRFRDRNTAFGARSKTITPKQRHKVACDKGMQIATHPLLWNLLARGGYNRAVEGGAA